MFRVWQDADAYRHLPWSRWSGGQDLPADHIHHECLPRRVCVAALVCYCSFEPRLIVFLTRWLLLGMPKLTHSQTFPPCSTIIVRPRLPWASPCPLHADVNAHRRERHGRRKAYQPRCVDHLGGSPIPTLRTDFRRVDLRWNSPAALLQVFGTRLGLRTTTASVLWCVFIPFPKPFLRCPGARSSNSTLCRATLRRTCSSFYTP